MSLLAPYPNKFAVVCICIVIFHSIYSPLLTNIFLRGAKFFLCLVARGWKYFKLLGDFLYWRVLIFFLGERGLAIFFHKAINDQSCKLKNSWRQNYLLHVCMLTFHTYFGIFSLRIFCLFKSPPKLPKKCLLLLGINSVKVWILFDMSSK